MRLPARLEVLRERDFRLVFGAQVVSLFGDGIIPVALAFAVLDLTGRAAGERSSFLHDLRDGWRFSALLLVRDVRRIGGLDTPAAQT